MSAPRDTPPTRYAYLHGLASGPRSRKGVALRDAFARRGVPLALPDLNRPSFERLSHAAMIAAVDALAGPAGRWSLVGSSLGGWVAARWAELHPDRVERLVLLCPGFDLAARWPALLGAEALARWEAEGALPLADAEGVTRPLHVGFLEEARRGPGRPVVPCPTLVVHGTRDEVVPIEGSRRYAAAHPDRVRLVEVDDDHGLVASLPTIVAEAAAFLGLPPEAPAP